jgi:hypothetical protein
MNPRDAIVKALTPGDMFNQKNHIWRSIRTLTQFASCDQAEVLNTLDEHFQNLVSVKPNTSHPEHGPLVALNQFLPIPEPDEVVAVMGGPAVGAPPQPELVEAGETGFGDIAGELAEEPAPQPEAVNIGGGEAVVEVEIVAGENVEAEAEQAAPNGPANYL